MFPEPARPSPSTTPILDQVGIDLTAQARQGKLPPVVGRDQDLERVIQVLSRLPSPRTGTRKNNVALISEPERGHRKMAIVEGLAQQMISSRVPAVASGSGSAAPESSWLEASLERLPSKRLVRLDAGLLVADTTSHSEFEDRAEALLEFTLRRGAGNQ